MLVKRQVKISSPHQPRMPGMQVFLQPLVGENHLIFH